MPKVVIGEQAFFSRLRQRYRMVLASLSHHGDGGQAAIHARLQVCLLTVVRGCPASPGRTDGCARSGSSAIATTGRPRFRTAHYGHVMDAPRAAHKSWAEQGHNSDELQLGELLMWTQILTLVQAVLGAPCATGRAVITSGYQSVLESPWPSPK